MSLNNVLSIRDCDTMSEKSDTATVTSESNWGSKEELRDFVTRHGLKDIADLYQERFRVDRRKLEQMLSGDNEALVPADVFFAKIMDDTDTYIIWPNKLKLGAKSKKDPHVKVAGTKESVLTAKDRILAILSTRCNRVTMKMDISYTDHSHIIGKDGLSIKRVMEETQCHVHFPDSNRSNLTEKSNQVSISGDLEHVEMARSRVRELIPLIFGFEPPITQEPIDKTTPFIIDIQEKYKVQVIFRTRSKLHSTIVLVKGPEWELENVKKATLALMEFMYQETNIQVPIQMSIQISAQNHATVFGKNLVNLKAIMHYTNTKILVPDTQDQNIPNLKKSNICITGNNIHDVYRARQLLMGSLPLLIIFDLPEEPTELRVRPEDLQEIQNTCDVSITIRQKNRQTIKACIVKGIERSASKIYQARNMILGIDEPSILADIPEVYILPSTATSNLPQYTADLLPSPMIFSPIYGWQLSPANMMQQQQQQQQQLQQMQQQIQKSPYNSGPPSTVSSGFYSGTTGSCREYKMFSSNGSAASTMSSFLPSPGASSSSTSSSSPPPQQQQQQQQQQRCNSQFPNNLTSEKSDQTTNQLTDYDRHNDYNSYDYEARRLASLKAMQTRPNPNVYRMPNNIWSGYGFSHTSPASLKSAEPKTPSEEVWKSPNHSSPHYSNDSLTNSPINMNLHTSNILDHTPIQLLDRIRNGNWEDLPALLTSLGLDRYITLFIQHEVDLETFATFNEKDLITIGINAYGSRRKMLLAISELNKRSKVFSLAPGAERRNSKPNSTSSPDCSPRENW